MEQVYFLLDPYPSIVRDPSPEQMRRLKDAVRIDGRPDISELLGMTLSQVAERLGKS